MPFIVNGELDTMLTALVGAGFLSSGVTMHLFKNNTTFSATSVIGDFTESSYSGYSPQPVNPWSSPSGGSGGTSSSAGTACLFNPGTLGLPENAYGWYVLDFAGNLLGGDIFAGGPLNMGGTVTALTIAPSLTLS